MRPIAAFASSVLLVSTLAIGDSALQSSPQVVYATYIGGRDKDVATALAIDSAGNAWVAGNTPSPDFPVTRGAFKTRTSVNNDDSVGFATKLSPAGDRFLYSTFAGGSWRSSANGIAVDSSGEAAIVGSTCSVDFPVTENALQQKAGGGGHGLEPCDGYVLKLDPSGSRAVYATYFGGSDADTVNAVALDRSGRTVVAGWTRSPDLFGTTGRGESDGFIAMLDAQGTLLWIRRFGGSGVDWFTSVAIAPDGTIWAAGTSDSEDLPCSGTSPSRPYGFVVSLRADLNPVCTRFAGEPAAIAVDENGHVYVAGSVSLTSHVSGFALRLKAGHIDWYRQFGGSDETRISGMTAGLPGSILLCGSSYSRDFPVTRGALARHPGRGSDMILLRLSAENGRVLYGTFLGGNAAPDIAPMNNTAVAVEADAQGNVWIAGNAIGNPRWISPNAAQSQHQGNTDVFVLKLKMPARVK
jgi:hypothetical protein